MRPLTPALQYSEGRSKVWAGAKCVNCFAEKADGDKRQDFAVMLIPGTLDFADISSDAVRGSIVMGDLIYTVVGQTLYSVDDSGTKTALGAIPGTDEVRMAMNGTQVAIASETVGYVYAAGTVQLPANLPAVSDVGYIDGYFVWTSSDFDQFTWSSPTDGLVYDGSVASVEGSPDGLKGMLVDHREILFLGDDSIEIYDNTGDLDAPFQRMGNAFIERGVFSKYSAVKIDNGVHFMGDDRIVYRLNGYTPARISTHAIEYKLRDVTIASAFTYTQEGHKFYCLRTDNGTFCYDMATGAWHERKSAGLDYWRIGGSVSLNGQTYVTDNVTGKIYIPSLDSLTENGAGIEMEIVLPSIEAARERQTMYAFELMAETGVGNDTIADPQVALSYSDDGGRLWSNDLTRSLGVIGDYRRRAIWRRVGQRFRQRTIKLRFTDPCRRFVFGYFADISA